MRNRIIRFWCQTQVLFLGVMLLPGAVWSQTAPIEGLRTNTPQVHALINARIVQQPGKVVEKGTVVLRDGVIASVGENVTLPADESAHRAACSMAQYEYSTRTTSD